MMKNVIAFAQKGLVLDKTRTKLLTIKYGNAKYTPEKVSGKCALPGGKIDFGETVDKSFIREVEEETGIIITPGDPFHVYSWTYNKDDSKIQIIALARIGFYKTGNIHKKPKQEKETTIESVQWIYLDELDIISFTNDEQPVIKKFLEYSKKNLYPIS